MAKSANVQRIHDALRRMEKKANVSAYVVIDKLGNHVGTVRFSYPRDGAGKLQALVANWAAERPRDDKGEADFTNWSPWQYGWANGGGYDKQTAAISGMNIGAANIIDCGYDWSHQLREAGYIVINAV